MLIFKQPSETEFRQVQRMARRYELGNGELRREQFTILKNNDTLLGFASLRSTEGYTELETLAVSEPHRGKGWGKMLVKKVQENGPDTIWLATDMPKYFEKLSFVTSKQVPRELARKINPDGPPFVKNGNTRNRMKAMVFMKKKP